MVSKIPTRGEERRTLDPQGLAYSTADLRRDPSNDAEDLPTDHHRSLGKLVPRLDTAKPPSARFLQSNTETHFLRVPSEKTKGLFVALVPRTNVAAPISRPWATNSAPTTIPRET